MQRLSGFQMRDTGAHKVERALIERILSSSTFAKSVRLREFLRYICDCALSGHPEEVHEQFIGHHVFNRLIDYSPTDDNIVRVSARQLRAKLYEYFETDGRSERLLVEIPKGSYLPVFREREAQDILIDEKRADTQTRWLGLFWISATTLAAVGIILTLLNLWQLTGPKLTPIETTPSPSGNFVIDLFAGSPGPVQIVISDSTLVLMEKLVGHEVNLSRYANRAYFEFPRELSDNHRMRLFWNFLATRQMSTIGDEEAAERFLLSMSGHRTEVTVKEARNMTARDFISGNFILLGDSYSNPWTRLFSKGLNFQCVFEKPGGPSSIRNLSPAAGEQKVYSLKGKRGVDEVSYAHVAFVSNLTNSGRVLLVAGISMDATEAAADFLLNPATARELQPILQSHTPRHIPNFELLLKTSAIDNTPNSARIIAHRVYNGSTRESK